MAEVSAAPVGARLLPARTTYYDDVADHYTTLVPDWPGAVARQGAALDRLIRSHGARSARVLDCSCGVGTQALGLAARGHDVTATDLSKDAVDVAATEALRAGLAITFGVADMRDLPAELGTFDIVVSCDNSLPHLLTDDDAVTALRSMRRRLDPSGLLVVSIRDYDRHRVTRPAATTPHRFTDADGDEVVSFQSWDWLDDERYHARQFVVTRAHRGGAWSTQCFEGAVFRAYLRSELAALTEQSGFADVRWLLPEDSGYHQPLLLARASR